MRITLKPSSPFNLDATLCCGQAFRWDKRGEWWYGVTDEKAFKTRQKGNELEFENIEEDFAKHYFGLHDDLPKIFSQIEKDRHAEAAIKQFRGLRILRQDPWECLISYICATYKNIAAIKRMLLNLARKFGEKIYFEGNSFYAFPTPTRLAKAHVNSLIACGLGYRARYVSETARKVCENSFEFDNLRRASYEQARNALLDFAGVGLKVADCISLFSLEKLEAFPVDVWMRRVVLRHYQQHFPEQFIKKISEQKSLNNSEYVRLNLFGREYFGKYAGYAQEYLYHYERSQE